MEGKAAKQCEFANDIVAYLYRENSDAERNAFEDHLLACASCTDGFAEMAESRFAVYEWQREEFAPLETPKFTIPYDEPRLGLLAGLRDIVTIRWAVPAFAAAVLAVAVGLGSVFSGDEGLPIAVANVDTSSQATVRPDVIEPKTVNEPVVRIPDSPAKPIEAVDRRKSTLRPVRTVAVEKKPAFRAPRTVEQTRSAAVARAPALSADAEVDDSSLRLSDIFDSEGT